jgi:hypothetical protein
MSNTRELVNSPIKQSVREKRAHTVQLAAGLSATDPVVKVFDESTEADISNANGVLDGTPTIASSFFTTPLIQVPIAGRGYRVECWFKTGGEQWIRYFRILAEA